MWYFTSLTYTQAWALAFRNPDFYSYCQDGLKCQRTFRNTCVVNISSTVAESPKQVQFFFLLGYLSLSHFFCWVLHWTRFNASALIHLSFLHALNLKTYLGIQTCHSIEMKNLVLTNKKSGSRRKNRDHGRIGYTNRNSSPKARTNSICSSFLQRNVLNCQTSVLFPFLLCVCVCLCCFLVFSLRPAHSWLSFLTRHDEPR